MPVVFRSKAANLGFLDPGACVLGLAWGACVCCVCRAATRSAAMHPLNPLPVPPTTQPPPPPHTHTHTHQPNKRTIRLRRGGPARRLPRGAAPLARPRAGGQEHGPAGVPQALRGALPRGLARGARGRGHQGPEQLLLRGLSQAEVAGGGGCVVFRKASVSAMLCGCASSFIVSLLCRRLAIR